HTTTPEAFDLQSLLAKMEQARCQAVVLETTSHALDQERVAYIDYDVGVVTNVTHEHLDWHGSWENYMQAKARLFHALTTSQRKPDIPKVAVLNRADASYPILREIPSDETLTYALDADVDAQVTAKSIATTGDGTLFRLVTPAGEIEVRIALLGSYNVANALAAAAAGLSLGASLEEIARGLQAVKRITGRMEFVFRGEFDV